MLIVIVVAVVALYAFLEFRTSEIYFESDVVETWDYGARVKRIYRSGVDEAAFFAQSEETLVTAEFTEEEMLAAALASGTPEFCPAFYLNIYKPDGVTDIFRFVGSIKSEALPEQTSFNFAISDLHLEIMTDGVTITGFELTESNGEPSRTVINPIVSEDRRTLAVTLGTATDYTMVLTGLGRVTFQFNYTIVTNGLFRRPALEEQLLIIHANISRGDGGELLVEYISEPYSMIEEFTG